VENDNYGLKSRYRYHPMVSSINIVSINHQYRQYWPYCQYRPI